MIDENKTKEIENKYFKRKLRDFIVFSGLAMSGLYIGTGTRDLEIVDHYNPYKSLPGLTEVILQQDNMKRSLEILVMERKDLQKPSQVSIPYQNEDVEANLKIAFPPNREYKERIDALDKAIETIKTHMEENKKVNPDLERYLEWLGKKPLAVALSGVGLYLLSIGGIIFNTRRHNKKENDELKALSGGSN